MSIQDQQTQKLFIKSALSEKGGYLATSDVLIWLQEQNNKVEVQITRCPLKEISGWHYNEREGRIKHNSKQFFSVDGIEVSSTFPVNSKWHQPIINQPEIGYLGIITKEIGGILHFLLQAKIEPGNVNYIQLSPTLQATYSNYTQVHKGKKPLYLEYFHQAKMGEILVDQLQSEQGGSFLKKRNRNMIIKIDGDIKLHDQFIWLTLGQIKKLITHDNVINMCTRSILSSVVFASNALDFSQIDSFSLNKVENPLNTTKQLMTFLVDFKARHSLKISPVRLPYLEEWIFDDMSIYHQDNKYFKVIGVDVEINSREVIKWSQPLFKPIHQGLCAFILKDINGTMHFLVQGKVECGYTDIVELAPTVQILENDYKKIKKGREPFLDLILKASQEQVLFDTLQSEEGGRFYQDNNRYMIIVE